MVNDWLNSLDDERVAAPARSEGRVERRPDASALGALLHFRVMTTSLMLIGLVLGAAASYLLVGSPKAQARFAVADPRGNDVLRQGVTSETSFQTYTAQRAVFADSDRVLTAAAGTVGVTATALRDAVDTAVSTDGALVIVTATADSADRAREIATAVVGAYQSETSKDLHAQADAQSQAIDKAKSKIIEELQSKPTQAQQTADATALAQLQVRSSQAQLDANNNSTRFVDDARALPLNRTSKVARGAGIGAAVGLLLAAIIAFALADQVAGAAAYRRHTRSLAPAPAAAQRR